MGVPLMIVGGGGHWLPRAGAWMNTVKGVFGFGLLGVALAAGMLPGSVPWLVGGIIGRGQRLPWRTELFPNKPVSALHRSLAS